MPLAKEEWDFSKCPCGEEEMCAQAEFRRESIRFWLERNPGKTADIPGPFLLSDQSSLNPPWWPNTHLVKLREIYSAFPACAFRSAHEQSSAIVIVPVKKLAIFPEFKGVRSPITGHIEYMGLRIDWTRPNQALLKAFAVFLRNHRPLPPTKLSGRAQSRRFRAILRALGAYRLLKAFTAEEAFAFTEKSASKPLFAKISDWYKAKARVKKILENRLSRLSKPPATWPSREAPNVGKRAIKCRKKT